MKKNLKSIVSWVRRARLALAMLFAMGTPFQMLHAQGSTATPSTDGITGALETVASSIQSYADPVQKIIFALAGVVAFVGAISIYSKMNNDDQDVKKSIMMYVGAFIFLIVVAAAIPTILGFA